MGWDITYHLISADEITSIYFRGLEDPDHWQALAGQFGVDGFYAEQLRKRFDEARTLEDDIPFNKGHAFYVAIVSGFLRKHHYIRGGAISFMSDDAMFHRYASDLQALVPAQYRHLRFDNRLTENYCAGAFLSAEALRRLRDDYATDPQVRQELDQIFSDGRLPIFFSAVDEALKDGLGLLEATEVVEPNPLDLNRSTSLTNLLNCYHDGAILYAETAMQQIASMKAAKPAPAKKSLWSRFFG